MAATAKWTAYAAADTAIAAASLNALASGAVAANYLLGSAIDNTLTASAGYLYGDLEVNLSSAVTAGAGAPFLAVYLIPALDGTNYATTNGGTTAGLTSVLYSVGTFAAVPSTAVKVMHIRGIVLPPCPFKIMVNNQLGVSLPATNTSTCLLYRYNEQSV